MSADTPPAAAPQRQLTLFDTVSIIVGIIIGSGIYGSSPVIAATSAGPIWWLYGLWHGAFDPASVPPLDVAWIERGGLALAWILGGLLALVGSLCYAELTSAWPRDGGDYVFLTRAFGRRVGFLFAWSQLWIIRPGSIGAMAFVFADYASRIWMPFDKQYTTAIFAGLPILVLTVVNILGVQSGKWTQNVLSVVKVVGLVAIVAIAYLFASPAPLPAAAAPDPGWTGFSLAMILVLYTYGGWNDVSYVSAEVREPEVNLPRGLILGTFLVAAIYLAISSAFARVLGVQGMAASQSVAADTVAGPLGDWAAVTISLLVCISCLGAINGMIFTGARIYYALGTEHPLWGWLAEWDSNLGTPVRSLLLQGAIALGLVYLLGFRDSGERGGSFEKLVVFTAPFFWFFLLLAGVALIVLRWREPETPRPYWVMGYPVTPLIFCGMAGAMLYASLSFAFSQLPSRDWAAFSQAEVSWGLVMLVIGVIVSLYDPLPPHDTIKKE